MSNESDLKLNLSWVLREPSTSHAVGQALSANRRFQRRRERILRTFQTMEDSELLECVHVEPRSRGVSVESAEIVTASYGVPELLPRVLELSGLIAEPAGEHQLCVIDHPGSPDTFKHEFFKGPARLNLPAISSDTRHLLVAGLVVRPGEQDLLLTTRLLDGPNAEHSAILRAIEPIVRDFVDQWLPERALWANPMEIERPEILQFARSAAGR